MRNPDARRLGVVIGLTVGLTVCLSASAGAGERHRHKKGDGESARAPSPRIVRMCTEAYSTGRQLQQTAHLREAKEQMLSCAQPSCGGVRHGFLRRDCLFRFSRIEADIPSVIPVVTEDTGEGVTDVQVMMDGTLLSARADGMAFFIDPGIHEFVFKKDGAVLAKRSVVVLQGQQNRPLTVTLPPKEKAAVAIARAASSPADEAPATKPPPREPEPVASEARRPKKTRAHEADETPADEAPAPPPVGHHLSFGSVSFGLIGLAGAGGFGVLTYWGRKDNAQLSQCAPNCPQASVDRVAKLYQVANISLGVGAGALILATWVYASSAGGSQETERRRQTAYRFDLAPTRAGAIASLAGRF